VAAVVSTRADHSSSGVSRGAWGATPPVENSLVPNINKKVRVITNIIAYIREKNNTKKKTKIGK
jgi:hypothetical protein